MLDRSTALEALEELARALSSKGIEGRLFMVGGAAMALAFDARRMSRDIDGVFEPKSEIYRAATEVAVTLDLPDDWLNDAVKGFVPGTDPDAVPIFVRPGLALSAASARFLLAMKLRSSRPEQDVDDITFLAALLGLDTAEQVLRVAADRYSLDELPPRARFLVDELFGPTSAREAET